MKQKFFSKQELEGLEQRIFSEDFTVDNIIGFVNDIRGKYLKEQPLSMCDQRKYRPTMLWPYTLEIDVYFSRYLTRPSGSIWCYPDKTVETENLEVDLKELLLMREEKKRPEPKGKVRAFLSRLFEDMRGGPAAYDRRMCEKHSKYRLLQQSGKYCSLFESTDQLKAANIDEANIDNLMFPMRIEPIPLSDVIQQALNVIQKLNPDELEVFCKALRERNYSKIMEPYLALPDKKSDLTLPDKLKAKVWSGTFNHETKEVAYTKFG